MKTPSFQAPMRFLNDLLEEARRGKLQLPDFQREWIWEDDRVKSLLASVTLSYPIGALMVLKTAGSNARFKPRPIEGVPSAGIPPPQSLVLDGQQRLTALYQAVLSGQPARTFDNHRKRVSRWYYIDIAQALNPNADREDAIISVPASDDPSKDRIVRTFRNEVALNLSTPGREYEQAMFPLAATFDHFDWQNGFAEFWQYAPDKTKLFNRFVQEVVQAVAKYQIPVITLEDTPKEAVAQIFEKVNTGGVPLNVFQLLTAAFAVDDFRLPDDWSERKEKFREFKVLSTLEPVDFLQAVSLLSTRGRRIRFLEENPEQDRAPAITCKRKDMLRMTTDEYKNCADKATEGFKRRQHLKEGGDVLIAGALLLELVIDTGENTQHGRRPQ